MVKLERKSEKNFELSLEKKLELNSANSVVLNTDFIGRKTELVSLDIKQKAKKLFATAAICAITSSAANAQAVKISSNDDVYFNDNVGIGKTTPAYKLDVYGNARFGTGYFNNNYGVIIGMSTYNCGGLSTSAPAVYGGGLFLGIPSNWARATFSDEIYYVDNWRYSRPTGDINLCNRITLTDVTKIRLHETPWTFVVRGDTTPVQMRYVFDPEELQAVFPQLVTVYDTCDGGESKYAIDYTGMVPILTAAINEQQEIIVAQQEEIQHLQIENILQQATINQHQTEIGILQQIVFGQELDLTELYELREVVYQLRNVVEDLSNVVNQQNHTIEELRRVILICCENTVYTLRQQDSTLLDSNSYNNRKSINNNIDTNNTQNSILNEAILYQNIPNPFSSNTEISCYVPDIVNNAFIYIYNLQGTELMFFSITQTGLNTVYVYASSLPAGMYLYTLVVDNVIIDSKRMILTK